jgi:hypothetical protein
MSVYTFGVSYQAPIGEPWLYQPMWYGGPAYQPPPCDHCLCITPSKWEMVGRDKPHLKCCHCQKLYRITDPSLSPKVGIDE